MSLLVADTTLIDQVVEEALRALDDLTSTATLRDLGCDPLEDEVDDRRGAAAPGAKPAYPVSPSRRRSLKAAD